MANNRVRVSGYAQRTFFNDNIEYRDFSNSLVGNQFTDEGGLSLFTLGNFTVTTNLDPHISVNFNVGSFSNFFSLNTLGVSDVENEFLLENNANVRLNLDESDLLTHAYFGSLTEFIRVNLEEIITNWVASIYMNPVYGSNLTGYTVNNYYYNQFNNRSTFSIDTNTIVNKYRLNYLTNGTILNTFNESNPLRNLTVNYINYNILFNNLEYPVVGFTGASSEINDTVFVEVEGNPFINTGNTVNLFVKYHIKPNKVETDKFFNGLNDFQYNLLNTLIKPKYTAQFRFPTETEDGSIIYQNVAITWNTSDGYNLDFDTPQYVDYVSRLIDVANNTDITRSNLIVRFLTSESISDFDTVPRCDGSVDETAGQKVNKTLKIYGRAFDDIKRYIDGIAYANTVTYDVKNNTPDLVLKNLARVIGWELVSSILENNLLSNYVSTSRATFSGQSRGLTPIEAEYEMWRRIVMNSPWIWKSKGTRKAIEFLFKFIGAPDGLVSFNEHVYVVNQPLNVDIFKEVLALNNLDTDLTFYNIDDDGYPKLLPNTPDMYFQKAGLWYRETGGANASIYVLNGNNPHIGPYDAGQEYINQLRGLIDGFEPVTITGVTVQTGTTALFTNYNSGLINNIPYSSTTFVDLSSSEGFDITGCYVLETEIIDDPKPTTEVNDCGCDIPTNDRSLRICINQSGSTIDCSNLLYTGTTYGNSQSWELDSKYDFYIYQYPQYNMDGSPATQPFYNSPYINPECCVSVFNGTPYEHDDYETYMQINGFTPEYSILNNIPPFNSGSICCPNESVVPDSRCSCFANCNWILSGNTFETGTISVGVGDDNFGYLLFVTPDGEPRVTTVDGCNCPAGMSTIHEIVDPFTGELGMGCRVENIDFTNLACYDIDDDGNLETIPIIALIYLLRRKRAILCNETPNSNYFDYSCMQ